MLPAVRPDHPSGVIGGGGSATEGYLPCLLEGRLGDLAEWLGPHPSVDDPMGGAVTGAAAFEDHVAERSRWLRERSARLEHIRTTHTPERTVVEWVAHLDHQGRQVPLPVAVVGSHPDVVGLEQVRVYHSMWPLEGEHRVRHPILPPDPAIELGDVIARYHQALAAGDVEAIVATFQPDGYFREPAGGEHVFSGTEALRSFMQAMLGSGGIGLEHCTATDDGLACAIEFTAVRFGSEPLAPQAGVAVYQRGPQGLLQAARIYDDVDVEAHLT